MSKTITIHDQEGNYREYVVSARAQLLPGVYESTPWDTYTPWTWPTM